MKHVNEKKQDLLLDALSCIDEDILERGLALRDGTATPAPKAAESASKITRPATVTPPLYDLTRQPEKPPKKNPWRVLAVVAAACLLLCVVPLSMWMVGSMTKNEAGDDPTLDGIQNGILDGDPNPGNRPGELPDDAPGDPMDSIPEAEAPEVGESDPLPEETALSTEAPMEEPTETGSPEGDREDIIEGVTETPTEIPVAPYEPEEWVWNTVSAQNGSVEKNTTVSPYDLPFTLQYSYTALVDTFTGPKAELEEFRARQVSPEDELVLDLFAQYYMTLYTMDYGSHFLLFHPAMVEKRFTAEVKPHDYQTALARINTIMAEMIPYDTVALEMSLTENRLLSGDELTAYLEGKQNDLAAAGLSVHEITAVRYFEAAGTVTVHEDFVADDPGLDRVCYCYEYDGVWYLDDDYMDDDLCIDFALSELIPGRDYLKSYAHDGRIAAIEEWYIRLEDGRIFTLPHAYNPFSDYDLKVGDSVTIRHYDCSVSVRMDPSEKTRHDLFRMVSCKVYDEET